LPAAHPARDRTRRHDEALEKRVAGEDPLISLASGTRSALRPPWATAVNPGQPLPPPQRALRGRPSPSQGPSPARSRYTAWKVTILSKVRPSRTNRARMTRPERGRRKHRLARRSVWSAMGCRPVPRHPCPWVHAESILRSPPDGRSPPRPRRLLPWTRARSSSPASRSGTSPYSLWCAGFDRNVGRSH